jgi:Tol biopolymer transport system component
MGDLPSQAPPSTKAGNDRLDSWKEIAAYLNRDVTTVQRWEKREGMPVHRHLHDRLGSVYAFRSELDAWSRSRKPAATSETPSEESAIPPASASGSISGSRLKWILSLVLVACLALAAIVGWLSFHRSWQNPIADARFEPVTDFDGVAQAATISRDGRLVAFLSDRDGQMDVWVTQLGSGQFHNLTHGLVHNLGNPEVRNLQFSPDGSQVAFWLRKGEGASGIGIWQVPTLGGEPSAYLGGVAEFDWSRDATLLAYHTPGPGDPMFVSDGRRREDEKPIFTAAAGLHSHFPTWSPDAESICFVHGALPDKLDLWRISPSGRNLERLTSQTARISHPVWLDARTLLYLASDSDGSGPWLYGMDVQRRTSERLSVGLDRYTSLAASADGRRLVASLAHFKRTLWRIPLPNDVDSAPQLQQILLSTPGGFAPRLGPGYLLYVSSTSTGDGIWREANGSATNLWSRQGAKILGAPAIAPNGKSIAFVVEEHGRSALYTTQVDGSNARMLSDTLDLKGSPAWAPDGDTITIAANEKDVPHLYQIPVSGTGTAASFVKEQSLDPAWSPNGQFVVYSGADVGTTFALKAHSAAGTEQILPSINLTRGGRHVVFLPGGHEMLVLRGDLQHKDLWAVQLDTGAQRQLTHFAPDFQVRDFDLSPDGREVVLEREQERSEVMLIDLPRR